MSKMIDMTGKRYNKLVVIERAPNNKDGRAMWKCKCDCGNEIIVLGKSLRTNHTRSCGHCGRDALIIDETGNRYGRLTVIKQTNSIQGRAAWECKCDCGNKCIVKGQDLRRRAYTSCGHCQDHGQGINEVGNKYGSLTVLKIDGIDNQGNIRWKCQCDCGSTISVSGRSLRAGTTRSCGCSKSRGEECIVKLLINANIPFVREKNFSNLYI